MSLLKQLRTHLDVFASHVYSNWGETFASRGQSQEAIKACTRSLELNPNEADAYKQRGIAYTQAGDYQNAVQDFNHALSLSSTAQPKAEIYARRGMVSYYMSDYAEAIADYNLALYYLPRHSMIYMYRGMAELAQYNRAAAIQDFGRAIQEDDSNYLAYRHRGDVHVALGNIKQAISDYWHYVEIGTLHNAQSLNEIRDKINVLRGQLAAA